MSGATANLPTLDGANNAGISAGSGLQGFLDLLGSLSSGSSSPLAGVNNTMGGLSAHLDIDVSGLTDQLPQAITTIKNALPDDSLKYVEDLEQAYQAVMDFLHNSELVKQIQAGSDLEHTALALVDDILKLFQSRLGDLAGKLIGADELQRVQQALTLIDNLRTNYAAHSSELPAFLSQNLLGVAPDLLNGVTSHVGSALAVLGPLSETSLAAQVTPARNAITAAFKDLAQAIKDFDPESAALYPALTTQLQALQSAISAGFSALQTFYQAMQTVVQSHAWDTIFTTYRDLLQALPLQSIPTIDDAISQIAGVLDDFLSQLSMVFSPEDLAARITLLSTRIQDAFAQSPLGQARHILLDFLDKIRQTIQNVPTEAVQQAVMQMLTRVKEELDKLGISKVRETIAKGFQDAKKFIDDNLNGGLLDQVKSGLQDLLSHLREIPIADVGEQLTQAINTAGATIQDLEDQLKGYLDQVRDFLAQLDTLSFKPVADEVIAEIDTIKSKLQAIAPNSLSDVEKLAIQAGLVVLRAIDLEGMINNELKKGFTALGDEIKKLLNQIIAAWKDFRHRIGDFDPQVVMGPLTGLLDQITKVVSGLNAGVLLQPLYDQVDKLKGLLEKLHPSALLQPLQGPYDEMMAVIQRVGPDVWVQPLRLLYAEIDKLIGYVDITPLLGKLEDKERELFAQARKAILDGLDSVHLPAPLDAFYGQLKTVALVLTDTVFGDPGSSIQQLNLSLQSGMSLSTLFLPLDLAFDQLLHLLDNIPRNDLVSVMEGLRSGLGMAMRTIDPRTILARLREGQGKLADLSPVAAAAAIPALPGLRVALGAKLALAPAGNQAAAAALSAQFDLTLQPLRLDVESSQLRQLQTAHQNLVTTLRLKINSLESTGAEAAYTNLDANLGRLLPAFLRQTVPLGYDQIRAGLAELRPTHKAKRLDDSLALFLSRLKPLESAINPAINGFFQMIRDALLIIHPGMLKDSVQAIYDTLRQKLHVLDPDQLTAALKKDIWEPLLDPLQAIDPKAIGAQLDGLYQDVVESLTNQVKGLIDQIKQAVDPVLAELRKAVDEVFKSLKDQLDAILKKLQDLLAQLDKLVLDDLFGRLLHVIDNLEASFNQELDRVRNEFDAMLNAIPLGRSGGGSTTAAVGT